MVAITQPGAPDTPTISAGHSRSWTTMQTFDFVRVVPAVINPITPLGLWNSHTVLALHWALPGSAIHFITKIIAVKYAIAFSEVKIPQTQARVTLKSTAVRTKDLVRGVHTVGDLIATSVRRNALPTRARPLVRSTRAPNSLVAAILTVGQAVA